MKCEKCNGNMFYDSLDKLFYCLQCGNRNYLIEIKTREQRFSERQEYLKTVYANNKSRQKEIKK